MSHNSSHVHGDVEVSRRRAGTLNGSTGSMGSSITDFFITEVFWFITHNPIMAYRFLRYCQSRNFGEATEFLQKVNSYNRLLDDVTQPLSNLHTSYTSSGAPQQIDMSSQLTHRVSADIRNATQSIIPGLGSIFAMAQEDVERTLFSDIYPRFAKHQMTTSATQALANNQDKFHGLGDCFV
ncbi:hypothetical protein B0O99DRAFT_685075 [Bisporella sp. PMI_857]|nr:hypothetical protein B0O99DRAFT_685075 [Bisporella sp. PMI_857]